MAEPRDWTVKAEGRELTAVDDAPAEPDTVTSSSAGGERGGAEMTSFVSHVPGIRATGSSHVAVRTTP